MAKRGDKKKRVIGQVARVGGHTVRSYQVGAVPLLRSVYDRMALVDKFRQHLPKETSRMRVPTAETLHDLIANINESKRPDPILFGTAFAPHKIGKRPSINGLAR